MRKYAYEVDLDAGTERFNTEGMDFETIYALLLRPINLIYSRMSGTRPDVANALRLRLIAEIIDPQSPLWSVKARHPGSDGVDTFVMMEQPQKGGDK